MKLHAITLLFLLGSIPTFVQGQYIPFVEEDKFWIYTYNIQHNDSYAPVSGYAITLKGDTVVNAIQYKKMYEISLKGGHNCPFPPCWSFDYPYEETGRYLRALIREDIMERKVYLLPVYREGVCDTLEHLLYDFAISLGDTLNACVYDFITGGNPTIPPSGLVDSIKVTQSFGNSRNTLFTYGIFTFDGLPYFDKLSIPEGVGLDRYGIILQPESEFVDFCEGSGLHCELLLSNDAIQPTHDVRVYPNPTLYDFTVSISEAHLGATCIIADAIGRVVQILKLTEPETAAHVGVPGIYFWQVELEGRLLQTGKIVRQ